MKYLLILVLGIFFPVICFAQQSDLELSGHTTRYFGNEDKLKRLTDPLRNLETSPITKRKDLCNEDIYEVGEIVVNKINYLIVYEIANIGNSCRGITNILFFKDGVFYGFYRTAQILKLKTEGSNLLFRHENKDYPYRSVDFMGGFPDKLALEANDNPEFIRNENTEGKGE